MKQTVVWKVSNKNINIASFRYRCLAPFSWIVQYDQSRRHVILETQDVPIFENIAAIVFVKSFKHQDLAIAREAHKRNIPIFIDLCDNFVFRTKNKIFVNNSEEALLKKIILNFKEMLSLSNAIVTTGEELKDKIIEEFPEAKNKTYIIEDAIESEEDKRFYKDFEINQNKYSFQFRDYSKSPILAAKFFKSKLRKKLISLKDEYASSSKKSNAITIAKQDHSKIEDIKKSKLKKLLWFGNSGIPGLYGLTDLLLIRDTLEKINRECPILLIVCSDNEQSFLKHINSFECQTQFFQWSLETNIELIRISDVVVIPNPLNEFTIGKSANRALLALEFEKPVVATKTKALSNLVPLIKFDDWEENIKRSIFQFEVFTILWNQYWSGIKKIYSAESNAQRWLELLEELNKEK